MFTLNLPQPLVRFAPPILWMGVIFALSSYSTLPGLEIIWWDFILKKSAHMFCFGVLFFLYQRSLDFNKPLVDRSFIIPFILLLVYAISDELHQSLTPGRHPSPVDVSYDMLGGFITYAFTKKYI